ncbi:HD-GYP domain-containing protein [Granulicella tundricola]|uniref:Metal dependent phosphohydrolase n=1 Tax=Granulicella tundricola (strain ATCC BAA-1859 / DSM 23138 / MP5ACTX9) TaxID=1198114 RepID=E8WV60_GRATM|nr:HD domain-containing protein [Granulicella tundricola]ADW67235.1 metal dependent phosphohydrolase [Granulicella tundricola MP5ACTX9]
MIATAERAAAKSSRSQSSSNPEQVTFSSIIAALSFALDLTEGAQPGHALRTCLIGIRIGTEMGLSQDQLSDLYYALLLKDAGCSSNATRLYQIVGGDEIRAKAFTKTNDWTRFEWKQIQFLLRHVHAQDKIANRFKAIGDMIKKSSQNAEILFRLRCNQGAQVVRDLGLGQGTADAVYNLDEHWNGLGYPDRLSGDAIPLLARIVSISQTLEVFHQQYGPAAALDCIQRRSGRWFDPLVVRAAVSLMRRNALFVDIDSPVLKHYVASLEPSLRSLPADPQTIDSICVAFAGVVDAKSHSTYMHSTEVARIAVELGAYLGLNDSELVTLRRAGLLHDIGKLSVPNSILDKPGKLDASEWACVKMHPHYTYEILSRIPTFGEIANISASHHEKLDGSGYYRGLMADDLCYMSRILTVADMFEALSANRPYRGPMSKADVLNILRKDVPHAIDPTVFAALESIIEINNLKVA